MPVSDWRILLRRWYVVLVGLLLTAGLCAAAVVLFPARWTTSSVVVLLPPETRVAGAPVNPFLNLGGLEGMADVLSASMSDAAVQREIADSGADAEYLVGRDPSLAGPVVVLRITAATRQQALDTQQFLLDGLPPRLDDLQQAVGVRGAARIRSSVITEDDQPEVTRRSQIRAVLVAAAGGLGMTYLIAAAVDGAAMARRRRRRPRRRDAVVVPAGPAGDHDHEPAR